MSNNQLTKKSSSDFVFIGLALFAMFFGAGNLIFPPDIGVRSGPDWFIGFFCFFLADAGLAILGMLAMIKARGKIENVTGSIGTIPAIIINTAVILCIGPGIAIPRTAAVTFELGLSPIFKIDVADKTILAIFSVVFFLIVLALTIKPSRVIDIVGKVLTPLLVIVLIAMIAVGVFAPKAGITEAIPGTSPVPYGVLNGYQTMDGMASLFFAIIVISAIFAKGYTSKKESSSMAVKSSLIAGLLLFIIYGGLTYLGATTGSIWKEGFASGEIGKAPFLINITNALLGNAGVIMLGLVVALACLTTAIGLTSATAEYFSNLSKGKLSYSKLVIIVCAVSAFLCNLGLDKIISIAVPVLLLVYPLVVMLMIASLFRNVLNRKNAYRLGGLVALVISAITVAVDVFDMQQFAWIHKLPLDIYGFNWLIPTIVAMVVGQILPGSKLDPIAESDLIEE